MVVFHRTSKVHNGEWRENLMFTSVMYRFCDTWKTTYVLGLFFVVAVVAAVTLSAPTAAAAQTVPYKINYQGRLTDSSGTPLANGTYNMKLRLFSVATGGAAVWTEIRDVTTQMVTVTNGQFAVQLGDVTALSPSLFTSQPLYLEVELPSVATATCSTAACASYTEGPMTPRQAMASAGYAINADQVDGIDGASIARIDTANTFSGNTTLNGAVTIGSTNSTGKFVINDNSAIALFTADTSNTIVKVGTTGSATLGASVRLLSTSAEFNGTVRVGNATDGVDISGAGSITLNGAARHSTAIVLSPEYAGAVLDPGSGANNTGTMTSKFDLTNRRNYYKWTTTQGTAQSYDVVVQVPIPSGFSAWATTTPITVDTYTSNTSTGTVTIEARDTAGTVVSGINFASVTPSSATTWQSVSAGTISGTYTAGSYMTLRLRMTSPTSGDVRLGNIQLNYLAKW